MATSFIELDVWVVVTSDKTVAIGSAEDDDDDDDCVWSMAVASVWEDGVGLLLGMAMDGSG